MYWVSVVTEAGIFAILALGLDVIWGWGGDFDLAFYGYLALGSYLTFVLTIGKPTPPVEYILGYHLPVVLAIGLAMVVVVGLAAIIGAIALRNLREIYFAVTTLGAVSALYLLVENYTPLFDGYNGVYGLINPGQTALNLTYNGYRIFFLVSSSSCSSWRISWYKGCHGARSAECCARCARMSGPPPPTDGRCSGRSTAPTCSARRWPA